MIELLIKVTLSLTLALALNAVFRRTSAAILHLLWVAAMFCVLAVPFVQVPRRAQVNTALMTASAVEVISGSGGRASINLPAIFTCIWACGAILVLFRLGVGLRAVHRITRHARAIPWEATTRVPVFLSGKVPVPMTWGFFRPVILLPESALAWPPDRLRSAIEHEQAHVHRHDWLTQMVSEAACALYWFHPLIWVGARMLHLHGERACDDRVLLSGVPATGYASDLVEIARLSRAKLPGVLAMATRNLEERVRAVLDEGQNRRVPGRLVLAVYTVAAVMAVLPLVAVHVSAQSFGGRLSGSVRDASGAMVPGVNIGAENLDGDNQEAATTNAVGRFQFTGMPAGRYRITVEGPGFKQFHSDPVMVGNGEAHLDATLDIGGVFERVQVVGQRIGQAQPASTPRRVRIGGNVQATRLTTKIDPVYPVHALGAGIEGTVLINAVIGLDGVPTSLVVLSKSADGELVTAAVEAVRQWRYQPVLLNGAPVEVVTTIAVDFHLKS